MINFSNRAPSETIKRETNLQTIDIRTLPVAASVVAPDVGGGGLNEKSIYAFRPKARASARKNRARNSIDRLRFVDFPRRDLSIGKVIGRKQGSRGMPRESRDSRGAQSYGR